MAEKTTLVGTMVRRRVTFLRACSLLCGLTVALPAHAAPTGSEAFASLPAYDDTIVPITFDVAGRPDGTAMVPATAETAFSISEQPRSTPEGSADDASQAAPVSHAAPASRYRSFGDRAGAIKWETGAIFAVITATNIGKLFNNPHRFRFHNEGLFGRNTANLGVDKLAHSYNTYLFSEILYRRIGKKTGGGPKSALTAAVLATGIQFYGELYDGVDQGSGFSVQDIAFNMAGAGFSVLRNSVPGLKQKVDFRISIVPNHEFYTYQGKEHFEQERFLFALKASGFPAVARTPMRFLEFHVGYYEKKFSFEDRRKGLRPERKPFVGLGVNFQELLFKRTRSPVGRAVATGLEYFQIPYTSLIID
jgi:hypothetical protein